MKIERYQMGILSENGYILYHGDGGSCLVIDPGYRAERYLDFVKAHHLTPAGIVLTHRHNDHTAKAAVLRDAWHCETMMEEEDAAHSDVPTDRKLHDGEKIFLGDEPIRVLHTPGHTEGSICLLAEQSGVCFTGDTVFDTELGRTDFPGGSEQQLIHSVREVIEPALADDIHIYPGHEGDCTMRDVREKNEEYRCLLAGKERV